MAELSQKVQQPAKNAQSQRFKWRLYGSLCSQMKQYTHILLHLWASPWRSMKILIHHRWKGHTKVFKTSQKKKSAKTGVSVRITTTYIFQFWVIKIWSSTNFLDIFNLQEISTTAQHSKGISRPFKWESKNGRGIPFWPKKTVGNLWPAGDQTIGSINNRDIVFNVV